MRLSKIIDLNFEIAINSAKLSQDYKIPLADSVILATANYYNATIYTQDSHFKYIKGVKFIKKTKNKS
jgi:toxin FitB